jgi:hypothetical protein
VKDLKGLETSKAGEKRIIALRQKKEHNLEKMEEGSQATEN